jgi:hypothetical protein
VEKLLVFPDGRGLMALPSVVEGRYLRYLVEGGWWMG